MKIFNLFHLFLSEGEDDENSEHVDEDDQADVPVDGGFF